MIRAICRRAVSRRSSTFAQVLTESAKLAGNCLLVISLPASDTAGSPHAIQARMMWKWAASAVVKP